MALYPIYDRAELRVIESLKAGLVKEPVHLCLSWLSAHNWIVVPVESGDHFNREQAERLSAGFVAADCRAVFAVATEDIGGVSGPDEPHFPGSPCYTLDVSPESLRGFSELCTFFNFVLIPANRAMAVLCTVNDYYLVAGRPAFVKPAVGGDIEAAWGEFRQCAADPVWEGRLEKYVVSRYEAFSRVDLLD